MADIEKLDKIVASQLDKLQLSKEKELAFALLEAFKVIKNEISIAFEKWSTGGLLTALEMRKYQRLLRLEQNIIAVIKPFVKDINKLLNDYPTEFYAETFFREEWKFSQFSGIKIDFTALDKNQVAANLDNEFDDIAINDFNAKFGSDLRKVINTGLIAGQSYPDMVAVLKGAIKITENRAMKIFRTELATARNQATKESYIEADRQGIKGVTVWDAAIDLATRPSHGHLDNKQSDENGVWMLSGVATPYPAYEGLPAGERINCRCTLRYNPTGFTPRIRRIRDEGIVPYQSYDEYFSTNKKTLFA